MCSHWTRFFVKTVVGVEENQRGEWEKVSEQEKASRLFPWNGDASLNFVQRIWGQGGGSCVQRC